MSKFTKSDDGSWRESEGHSALWNFFGLSYASWLCLPRVMMHEMPDDWQARMAQLLVEFNDYYEWPDELDDIEVVRRVNGKMAKLPDWLQYRHPDTAKIESLRSKA